MSRTRTAFCAAAMTMAMAGAAFAQPAPVATPSPSIGATPQPVAAPQPVVSADTQEPPPPPPPAPPAPKPETPKPAKPARAQEPPPPPPPAPPPPVYAPGRLRDILRSSYNVQLEVTLREEGADAPALTRSARLVLAEGHKGSTRSGGDVKTMMPGPAVQFRPVGLQVDASVQGRDENSVLATITLEASAGTDLPGYEPGMRPTLRVQQSVLLQNGKPLVVHESADPVSGRRTTVELKATILK